MGVNRNKNRTYQQQKRFPHTRGGEPHRLQWSYLGTGFPHTRGGEPLAALPGEENDIVFPTRVGVNLERSFDSLLIHAFSPHAWG